MNQIEVLFVDRRELDEHRLTVHFLECGICGEMSNTRDEVKSCFFSHLVYVSDWSTTRSETVLTSRL